MAFLCTQTISLSAVYSYVFVCTPGSAFFASSAPSANTEALTPAEVRRQSRAYGIISKGITCVMWLLRLVWNILSTICGVLISVVRSLFDCPASSSASLPTAVANNFCEAMQHPVTRAQMLAEYRQYLFNIIVSNNFIGKSLPFTLLLFSIILIHMMSDVFMVFIPPFLNIMYSN